jgi:hypothetical protein
VVDAIVQLRPAIAEACELRHVGPAGRGVAVKHDRARVGGLPRSRAGHQHRRLTQEAWRISAVAGGGVERHQPRRPGVLDCSSDQMFI